MKLLIGIVCLLLSSFVVADDLDDGIKLDDPINDDLKLEINQQYIMRRAKAAAEATANGEETSDKVIVSDSCGGTGNQVFGAGTNLQGAVIVNLSDNRGSNSACVK